MKWSKSIDIIVENVDIYQKYFEKIINFKNILKFSIKIEFVLINFVVTIWIRMTNSDGIFQFKADLITI